MGSGLRYALSALLLQYDYGLCIKNRKNLKTRDREGFVSYVLKMNYSLNQAASLWLGHKPSKEV
jgi:hypothetical protein